MPRPKIEVTEPLSMDEIFKKSLTSGISGMSAMVVQVCSLMWMRTIMNYQYRRGGKYFEVVKILYEQGGIRRFYRGIGVALFQGPLSRFGDTFSNTLFLSLMQNYESTKNLNVSVKTFGASMCAALYRISLTPIDTTKTILQVEGKNGLKILMNKFQQGGIRVMYHGALASSSASFVGHYPWFLTFNFLNEKIPQPDTPLQKFLRRAGIGFTASIVSDSISNSLRVIKTTKQTYERPTTYPEVVKEIIESDGILGLMGRGLKTRIMTNGMQGLMFSVLWKYFEDFYSGKREK